MSTLTLTWPQVLLLLMGFLAIYGLEMAFFYWRLRKNHFGESLTQLRLRQLEERLQQLEIRLHASPVEAPSAEAPAPADSDAETSAAMAAVSPESGTSYNRAIDLARQGADATILSRDCGLSRGEADLIVSLYGRARK